MKTVFYRLECLTNLHVGSGDSNYNIVDNEVEKDITGLPMIHASGIKGALREALTPVFKNEPETIEKIFGKKGDKDIGNSGSHKFLDAFLLSRPLRVYDSSESPCVSATTIDAVNQFLTKLQAFGISFRDIPSVDMPDFGENMFLTASKESLQVEGDQTAPLSGSTFEQLSKLKDILFTAPFAVAKSFDEYALPVMARNCIEKGHENLWYEEVVPHGSVFYFAVVYPTSSQELPFPNVVQFGGNASIGCGLTRITKIAETEEE